jgi:hypothetical protein
MAIRVDRATVQGKAHKTEEGYIRGTAVVTRVGVLRYRNADGTIRLELRHPRDVFEPASLDSLKMIPVTNQHPEEVLVTAENARRLGVGSTGEDVRHDGQLLLVSFVITDAQTVAEVETRRRVELSLGYTVDRLEDHGTYNGEEYTHRQTNIRYNHLAVVDRARAGALARINLDSEGAVEEDYGQIALTINIDGLTSPKTPQRRRCMPYIVVDGVQHEVTEQVAVAYGKMSANLDAVKKERDAATDGHETAKKDLSRLGAEKDAAQARLDALEKRDVSQEVRDGVKARRELERQAEPHLDAEQVKNLDNLGDADLRKAVIAKKLPGVSLDNRDDVALDALFSAALAVKTADKAPEYRRQMYQANHDGGTVVNADAARDKMIEDEKNAYKCESK